jgi:hypothetical protein
MDQWIVDHTPDLLIDDDTRTGIHPSLFAFSGGLTQSQKWLTENGNFAFRAFWCLVRTKSVSIYFLRIF